MSLSFYLFSGLIGLLLFLLAWSVRKSGRRASPSSVECALEESERWHGAYLPQIRQALASADDEFLSGRGLRGLRRRVRRERQNVALAYLSALRGDFQGLLRLARVIAVLSPEIAVVQEFERLRLTVKFMWRFQMIRMELLAGFAPLPQMDGLSNLVSGFSVRLEAAMKELGERAAVAAELASAPDRRSINPV